MVDRQSLAGRSVEADETEVSAKIGLVVFRFNQIEGHSHRFAWHSWDWSDRIGRLMTAGSSLTHVWDLIEEGISSQDHRRAFIDDFASWRTRAEVLRKARNDVAHSEWWYHGSTFEIAPMDYTSTKTKRTGGSRWPVFNDWRSDLDRIADDMKVAVSDLLGIMVSVVMADQDS
jgi:hypothetical protein